MIGRVSTFSFQNTMQAAAMKSQSNYAQAASQKASGLVSDTYGGLGTNATVLLSTEKSITETNTWLNNTKTATSRVKSMYSATGNIVDLLTSFRSKLSAAKSKTTDTSALQQTAKNLLKDLASQMNLRQEGRYLFAGSNTDTAPVDITKLSTSSPSTASTAYYTGNSELQSVQVSGQQSITYGIPAAASGFEKALRAVNIIANPQGTSSSKTELNKAYELATKALDSLIAVRSGLSDTSSRLETAQKNQTSTLSLLNTVASEVRDVDVAQVTVKLSQYEVLLQSSYSALSKTSQLSLTKYL